MCHLFFDLTLISKSEKHIKANKDVELLCSLTTSLPRAIARFLFQLCIPKRGQSRILTIDNVPVVQPFADCRSGYHGAMKFMIQVKCNLPHRSIPSFRPNNPNTMSCLHSETMYKINQSAIDYHNDQSQMSNDRVKKVAIGICNPA